MTNTGRVSSDETGFCARGAWLPLRMLGDDRRLLSDSRGGSNISLLYTHSDATPTTTYHCRPPSQRFHALKYILREKLRDFAIF